MFSRSSFKLLHRRLNKLPPFPLRPHTTTSFLASPSNDTVSSSILTQLEHPNDQWHRNSTSRIEVLKLHGYLKSPNLSMLLTPTSASILMQCYEDALMVDDSLNLFRKLDPSAKSSRICNGLLRLLFKSGRIDDALQVLDEMLELESSFLLDEEGLGLLEKMKTRSKIRPNKFALVNVVGHPPKRVNPPLNLPPIHQSLRLTSNRIHNSPIRNSHSISGSHLRHIRCMSNVPENTVYSGPTPQNPNQRVTLTQLRQKHRNSQPITMVTAYDYPSAVHLDMAGIDICLVGDSGAMVVHGHDTTLPITVDEMLVHCRAVARGAKSPLLVGDLPFGSYESSTNQAVDTAVRILKEGGMDAIKLEGGSPSRIVAAKAIVEAGIAVMGHVGLTPQAISVLGGFRPQGRNIASAVKVVETALALQEAGCFSVVLECVPAPVAAAATAALQIPTIGIGAGPFCSGQVLVYHDLLGMLQHPHHAKVTPKFCKQYAHVGDVINKALLEYKEDVTNGSFPDAHHSPYKISQADANGFLNELQRLGLDKAASAASEAVQKLDTK